MLLCEYSELQNYKKEYRVWYLAYMLTKAQSTLSAVSKNVQFHIPIKD